MNDPDRDFNKDLDLHESEWTEAGKRQPIFGAGAGWFFKVTVPTIVCAIIIGIFAKWWVYFCIDFFGFPSGLFWSIPPMVVVLLLLLKPLAILVSYLSDLIPRLMRRG